MLCLSDFQGLIFCDHLTCCDRFSVITPVPHRAQKRWPSVAPEQMQSLTALARELFMTWPIRRVSLKWFLWHSDKGRSLAKHRVQMQCGDESVMYLIRCISTFGIRIRSPCLYVVSTMSERQELPPLHQTWRCTRCMQQSFTPFASHPVPTFGWNMKCLLPTCHHAKRVGLSKHSSESFCPRNFTVAFLSLMKPFTQLSIYVGKTDTECPNRTSVKIIT